MKGSVESTFTLNGATKRDKGLSKSDSNGGQSNSYENKVGATIKTGNTTSNKTVFSPIRSFITKKKDSSVKSKIEVFESKKVLRNRVTLSPRKSKDRKNNYLIISG